MAFRLTLTVPSEIDLPDDLYDGERDYHDGWVFDTGPKAVAFGEEAMRTHPDVVVGYEIDGTQVEWPERW